MKRGPKASRAINIAVVLVVVSILGLAMFLTTRRREVPAKAPAGKVERPLPAAIRIEPVKSFSFSEEDSLKEWEEKVFKGRVVYRVEKDVDLSYVRATSTDAASALYYKIKLDIRNRRPALAWKWKVDKFPAKKNPESLEEENEDDFAARVYVIFPAAFITNYKVLEYVWAETLPIGSTGTSPYSKNIKLIVLESGPAAGGEWRSESRDILADYQKMFGALPERNIGAVSFMTNTEHTGTSADAAYDDIKVGYKEGDDTGKGRQ